MTPKIVASNEPTVKWPEQMPYEALTADRTYVVTPPTWIGGHGYVVDAWPITPTGGVDRTRPLYRQWYGGRMFEAMGYDHPAQGVK